MSGAIATAYVKLIPTFDKQLSSSIAKQLGSVDTKGVGNRIGRLFTKNVDKGMSGLKNAVTSRFSAATVAVGNIAARAFTGVASAVASSMDSAIKRADIINNFPRIMEGMGIGADASAAAIKRLSDGIDGLPTALDDAVSGVSRFTAKNLDISRSTDYFLAVNNAIAAGGASMEIQSSALEQLSQSYSKGRMDMMEWRSLQQAMPAQLNQIAKAMGMTADELGEGLRKGDVSMDEFMDKIVELNKEGVDGLDNFEQQARKATGGIGTALTNVQNRVNKAVAGILDAIGQENISGAINAFSSKFGKIGSIIGGTNADGDVVGFVAGLKDGLSRAFDGWEPRFNINWDSAFEGAISAAQSFGEFISGPIATAIQTIDGRMANLRDVAEAAFSRLNLPEIDWNAVSDGISSVVDALINLQFDALDTAVSTLANVGSSLQDVFGPFIEKVGPGLESLGRGASEFFAPIADFIAGNGPAFDGMMERIQGHIDDMAPILDEIGGHFNNLAAALEPIAGPLGEMVAEVLSGIGSTLVGLGAIVLQIADVIMAAFDAIAQAVGVVGNAIDIAAEHFVTGWEPLPPMLWDVTDGVNNVTTAVNNVPTDEKQIKISVNDMATSVLRNVVSLLDNVRNGATATINSIFNRQASGGISMSPIEVPRHADGGIAGIATHAIMTNIGLVGEDGAEAIIPLTNQKYVKPFAQAVATAMGGGQPTEVHNHYTIGEMTVPADSALAAAMDAVFSQAQALQDKGAA